MNARMMNSALALTMLFAAGTAVAAPVTPSRESALSSMGKSLKLGVADFKERRAAAGPGFFKRTMTKTGAMLHATAQSIHDKAHEMHLSFKAHVAATKANLVDKGETIALKTMIATDNAKAHIKGAGETMALKAMYAGDKVKDVGETVALKTMIAADNLKAGLKDKGETIALKTMIAADNVKAFGNKVASNTKAGFDTAKGKVVAAKDKVVAAHEQRVAFKAADRDFQAWLKEPGNEDAATFYKGAAKDAHIGRSTAARNFSRGVTIANAAFAVGGNPINAAIVPVSMATTHRYQNDITAAKRTAAERTLDKFMGANLSAERLGAWSKAGLIDPSLAE